MGSRLKGKRARQSSDRDRRAFFKVLLYGLLGLGVVALLWYLWLSERGLTTAKDMKRKTTKGSQTSTPTRPSRP